MAIAKKLYNLISVIQYHRYNVWVSVGAGSLNFSEKCYRPLHLFTTLHIFQASSGPQYEHNGHNRALISSGRYSFKFYNRQPTVYTMKSQCSMCGWRRKKQRKFEVLFRENVSGHYHESGIKMSNYRQGDVMW